jgi:hypothetical protein
MKDKIKLCVFIPSHSKMLGAYFMSGFQKSYIFLHRHSHIPGACYKMEFHKL